MAGRAAARLARKYARFADRNAAAIGTVGLRPAASSRSVDLKAITSKVQAQTLDYDKALWRSAAKLSVSQALLDDLWGELSAHAFATVLDQVSVRETAAMTATARWCIAAAQERAESRGMHLRTDAQASTPERARRLLVGGLDKV